MQVKFQFLFYLFEQGLARPVLATVVDPQLVEGLVRGIY